jgi:hypothetical protein
VPESIVNYLEEGDARIRRLVDANVMGIFIWNLKGNIIEASLTKAHVARQKRIRLSTKYQGNHLGEAARDVCVVFLAED